MATTWLNKDNLYIKYGLTEGAVTTGGFNSEADAQYRLVELDIDWTVVTSSSPGAVILHDTLSIPKYARIDKVQLETTTAWTSGGSMTVDIGLVQNSDRATEIDFNGLFAAVPKAQMTPAGATLDYFQGGTYAGALLGTTTTQIGLLCVNYNTAIPTAGNSRLRVFYRLMQNR